MENQPMHPEKTFIAVLPNAPFFLWGNDLSQYILQNEAKVRILSIYTKIYTAYKQVKH